METLAVEEVDLVKLIALAQQSNHQFRITSEEGTIILLSEETYQNLVVTLEVLSTPGLLNSLKLFQHTAESEPHIQSP